VSVVRAVNFSAKSASGATVVLLHKQQLLLRSITRVGLTGIAEGQSRVPLSRSPSMALRSRAVVAFFFLRFVVEAIQNGRLASTAQRGISCSQTAAA